MQVPQHSNFDFFEKLNENAVCIPRQGMPTYPRPCDCVDCGNSFFSENEQNYDRFVYEKKVSDQEAQSALTTYLDQITRDRAFLLEQCNTRGDQIMTKWKKRTQQKRASVLLQADPELCQEPFFIPRFNSTDPHWKEARESKTRKAYLLPYLNVPVLAKNPAMLFGLLHYRTQYSPQDWAPFDSSLIKLGWASGLFAVDFNVSSVIMYGERYGYLTPWAADEMHRADTLGFPRARLVFEAQSTLLRLLRAVVEILLDGSTDDIASSSKWKEMVTNGFKKGDDKAQWSRFVHQPFSSPLRLNVLEMLAQAKARVDVTGDHLWLLQTEPAYLRHYIRTIKELSITKAVSGVLSYQIILGEVLGDIKHHWVWTFIYDELMHASKLFHRYRDSIHPGSSLPKQFDESLGALEILLVNTLHSRTKHMQVIIPFRPGFSQYYQVQYIGGDAIEYQKVDGLPPTNKQFLTDPLYWCLMQIQGPPDLETRYDYAMMFNFLDEHLAEAPKEERARLDATLYEKLSDYAVIIELLTTIRLSRPQNTNRKAKQAKLPDDRRAWRNVRAHGIDMQFSKKPDTAKALQDFYRTPLPSGGKDKSWVQAFDDVHVKLQAFWQKVYRDLEREQKKSDLSSEDIRANLEPIEIWNSPEHLRLIEQRKEDVLSRLSKPKPPTDFDVFLPFSSKLEESSKIVPQEVKEKIKTRGKATSTAAEEPLAELPPEPSTPAPLIKVSRKNLTTLRTMFPSTPEERAKTIDWDTFVNVMIDVGFGVRSGGGSIVAFEKGDGKIVFHKPHPVAKIDPIMFQAMGRRMNKWFGWTRDVFTIG